MIKLLYICVLSLSLVINAHARPKEIDRIVAVINKDVIMLSELKAGLKQYRGKEKSLPIGRSFKHRVLEKLMYKRLRQQILKKAGVDIGEETISKAIKQIADNNKMTIAELKKALPQQKMTMSQLRAKIKKEIKDSFFQQQYLANNSPISEQEINAKIKTLPKSVVIGEKPKYYHVLHILIATDEFNTAGEVKKLKAKTYSLIKQLRKKGADFKKIAKKESDSISSEQGGDLGWRLPPDFPDIIAKHVAKIAEGQIKGPIKDENGFHIIKVAETEGGIIRHVFSQEELKAQATGPILQQKTEEYLKKVFRRLRSESYVEIKI